MDRPICIDPADVHFLRLLRDAILEKIKFSKNALENANSNGDIALISTCYDDDLEKYNALLKDVEYHIKKQGFSI